MTQKLEEPRADPVAGLEEQNERVRAENRRLRGMLGLPAGVLPEPDVETARLFPEDDPLPKVHCRSPAHEKISLSRALFRQRCEGGAKPALA